ncbi:MAG: hypothetical protein F4X82_03250 [Candidatus Spechtbacteria bacterium SB0662_bin_43]|uniref:Antitoxin n=1 Tax=Candidatus Spechtbacteria bacterium SB0662_bin_43 TaxID=2604897 RepID=A0A845DJZ7_9BACT|nr:hypothetical protein [Candidatus Spechtbacteria bacterium SB0662_bin_43]
MWKQLQSLIRAKSDKAIIVEDGKPLYVVLTVEEYTRLQEQASHSSAMLEDDSTDDSTTYDQANQELSSVEIDEEQREYAEKFANLDNAPLQ